MNDVRNRRIYRVDALDLVLEELVVLSLYDAFDDMRLTTHSQVGKHRKRRDELAHRDVIDTKRDCRSS